MSPRRCYRPGDEKSPDKKPGFEERAQELGASAFLEKPVQPDTLLKAMATALYPKPD